MRFNPLNLSTPGSTGLYKHTIEEFKGIDKANGEDNFSPTRAKEVQNFIRDKVGTVKKRCGFMQNLDGVGNFVWLDYWKDYRIHYDGEKIHFMKKNTNDKYESVITSENHPIKANTYECAIGYKVADEYIILAKTKENKPMIIVLNNELLAGDVWTFYDNFPLNIKYGRYDEKGYLVDYNLRDMMHSDEVLPIPCIVEGAHPDGGGAPMYSPNLLCPYVCETFTVSKEDYPDGCARFQLSMKNITLVDGEEIITGKKVVNDEKKEVNVGIWEANNGDKYREKELIEGVSTSVLTEEGATVLINSLKIEVYKAETEGGLCYWQDITEGCFLTGQTGHCNAEAGAVWIPQAEIKATPVEGEPNVRITYIRNYDDYKAGLERLFSCNQAASFGVGGYKDRVFLTGQNRIYYSGMDSPLYFGELNYVEPCAADKSIVAMGGEGQVLYAVDSDGITHAISGTTTEDNTATFLSDATFVIADRVQGEKPIGSVLKIFGGEFCYLSEEGVVAIRHDNLYDKRYAQNRSRMLGDSIKGKIIGATVWGNFLVIATADKLYLLDELQQTKLADYKYSGVQYEVYPFSFEEKEVNGEIVKVWTVEEQLHLQTATGAEYVYNSDENQTDITEIENQTDITEIENQTDITAIWETPFFSLSDEHRLKRIQEFFLSVGAEGDAVTIEYQTDNDSAWRTLRTADGRFFGFNYKKINYGMFNYNPKVEKLQLIVRGRPSRAFRKIRFRFSSTGKHPLSLSSFGFYYKKEVI